MSLQDSGNWLSYAIFSNACKKYVIVSRSWAVSWRKAGAWPLSSTGTAPDWTPNSSCFYFNSCYRCCLFSSCSPPSPPIDNIRVMVIVWRLRGNIIRTVPCWVVWHNVHSQQHTHMRSSCRSSRLGLSHCNPYAVHRGDCLELYYCNMVDWCWLDSSLIWTTNWFPSVLRHCWFGHMTCKNRPRNDL